MTPYTSFLVMEDVKARPIRDARPTVRYLRENARLMPAAPAKEAREALRAYEGKGAVDAAVSLERMKKLAAPAERGADDRYSEITRGIREVDGKTYYLVDGRWTVSTWDGRAETVKVQYMSDEYFRLAREHPALARAFALGEKVVAEFEGRFYEVVE